MIESNTQAWRKSYTFNFKERNAIRMRSLKGILCDNLDLTNVRHNVFKVMDEGAMTSCQMPVIGTIGYQCILGLKK